jgi:UDP-MurNAc hydroxylase
MISLRYIGHAGWSVKGRNFKALFDPWFNPYGTFMNSWHQFPKNSHLLTDELISDLDFIYISHSHTDHYDEWTLKKIEKTTCILIPSFRDKTLQSKLKKLGFTNIREVQEKEELCIKGVKIKFLIEDGFNDRDSAIILDDGENKIINLNDCHPSFEKIKKYSNNVDILLLQSSSAIWWPCVYDYTTEELIRKCQMKRKNVLNRTLEYIKHVRPKYTVPNAGPPVFLHERFKFWDETRDIEFNPFPLHNHVDEFLKERSLPSMLVIPGSTINLSGDTIVNITDDTERDQIYKNFKKYLDDLREEKRAAGYLQNRFVPPQNLDNMVEKFSSLIRDIKKNSKIFIHKINFPVLIDFEDHSKWVIDFESDLSGCFQKYANQEYKYSFIFDPEIINFLINQEQIDFDEYFLSMRFSCSRKEDVFNEFLFAMFKNLDLKRFKISESLYVSQNMAKEDSVETFIVNVSGEEKKVQRYCPHQFVDLKKCGILEGDILTCPLHNWKFDLNTGECITSDKYCLSIEDV